jgi:hypothetical protein
MGNIITFMDEETEVTEEEIEEEDTEPEEA